MDINRYLIERIKSSLVRENRNGRRRPRGPRAAGDGGGRGKAVFDTLDRVAAMLPAYRIVPEGAQLSSRGVGYFTTRIVPKRFCAPFSPASSCSNSLRRGLMRHSARRPGKKSAGTLARYEKYFKVSSINLGKTKRELVEMLDESAEPGESRVRAIVTRYLRAILDQLKAQNAIYKCEYSLGNQLAGHANRFILDNLASLIEAGRGDAIKAASQIHIIAARMAGTEPKRTGRHQHRKPPSRPGEKWKPNWKKRRGHAELMERLISTIEKLVAESELDAIVNGPGEDKKASRRMAKREKEPAPIRFSMSLRPEPAG